MRKKSTVSLCKVHAQAMTFEIENAVKTSLDNINAIENLRTKGKKVLIKPNIASPGGLYSVNPSVTYAVAKLFADEGFEVIIGENPSIPTNEQNAYLEYGLTDIAERAGAKVVSFRGGPHTVIDVPGGKLFKKIEVTDYAIDTDIIVSVATMKSANIVTATLSVKNMKGVIPSKFKRKFHCEGLNDGITDLMKIVKPDLAVIDATMGKDMTKGCCFPVGVIISSEDALAADAVCAMIMGFDPERIEHLKKVESAGLGNLKKDDIGIVGENISEYVGKFPFSSPKDPLEIAKESNGRIEIIQGNPCCVCMNELGTVLHLFEDRLADFKDLTILVGPEAGKAAIKSGRTVIGYGNCVNENICDYSVKGCPPTDYRDAETGSLIDVMDNILKNRNLL